MALSSPTATNSFDLEISRDDLGRLAPDILNALREFVQYGLCRMNNQNERNANARQFAALAKATLAQFPQLKLNHCGAKTIIRDRQSHADDITTKSSADGKSFDGSVEVLFHRVTFSYWGFSCDLTPELETDLSEHVEQHAHAMILEGYCCGELCYMAHDDQEFRGWWEISRPESA